MISPIQLLLLVFLIFAISRVYLQIKQGTLRPGETMFWISLFSMAIVGVLDPEFTSYLAGQLGIGRGADVAIYLSLVLLFYLIFRTNIMLENLRHEVTKLVREISLNKARKPKK